LTRTAAEAAAPREDSRPPRHTAVWVWVGMLIASLASLYASFVLATDAIKIAEDPTAELGCNINSVISCGTVAGSWQASVLGFPNAFLGLVSEPVVITIAVAGLAGVRFPRWFMLAAQVFYAIGFVFAYWLFHQAMFDIGALCPWCMLVTIATTFVFFEITRVNILEDNLYLPQRVQGALVSLVRMRADVMLLVVWLLLLVLAVVLRYGEALFA
jgi:uncharacterized membrane protein